MNLNAALFIARRAMGGRKSAENSITAQKRRNGLRPPASGLGGAIVAIGVSIVPLILVLVVSDGMIEGITRRYIETKSHHLQVSVPMAFGDKIVEKGIPALESLFGISQAYLERIGTAVAVSGQQSHAVVLRALPQEFFEDPGTMLYLKRIAGESIPRGGRGMVLGSALAQALKVDLGELVTIITPLKDGSNPGEYSGYGYAPRLSIFRVTGIVSAGYRDLDALWAFISPEAGNSLLSYPSSSAVIGIKVNDPYDNTLGNEIRGAIVQALESLYPDWFEENYVRTWPEVEQSLYANFGTTKTMLLFIMAIILLVAAINLGSALSTFVAERSMDIAVLRSMGASDRMIGGIFAGAGLLAGAAGTVLGVGVGLILALNINGLIGVAEWAVNIADSFSSKLSGRPTLPLKLLDPGYYLESIPLSLDLGSVVMVIASSLVLSAAVSLIPSRKAVRMSVQDLIRKS
ncbi:MAG: lipoprotein-releasing system permease protein [Spirochaetes bacterium]|nr:MAG: lipoprotein-releasing system permease protein [Spirochaetota bacterium]